MPAKRVRILWGDELAGSLHRRSFPLWQLEAFAVGVLLAIGAGLPLCVHTYHRWGEQGREAAALDDDSHRLQEAFSRAERGRQSLRRVMGDNQRMLAQLTEHQATPALQKARGQMAGADTKGSRTTAKDATGAALRTPALPDIDTLWMRGQRQEAVLTRLLDYWQHAERRLRHTPATRPVPAAWLSSSYGIRHDPMSGALIMHKGLDLAGFVGMPVAAPADGVVIWVGLRGGYGQTVVVDHGWGLQTHYAHLSKYLVQIGQPVKRGAPLAEMGSTGKSTGPHLHYEVRLEGFPIDPHKFILD